jgi:hypothetical protein
MVCAGRSPVLDIWSVSRLEEQQESHYRIIGRNRDFPWLYHCALDIS